MEDLSDWKVKIVGTMLSQNEIILCLKNIACMHARFWGEKKKDIEEFLRYLFYRSIYSSDNFRSVFKIEFNFYLFAAHQWPWLMTKLCVNLNIKTV